VTTNSPAIEEPVKNGRPHGGAHFDFLPGQLVLADGTHFEGLVPSWQPEGEVGEVVFNTGMTGYTETLTDPSYAGQILTFTYPLIGNYGVADKDVWESTTMHLRGVVTSELTRHWSHWTGQSGLLDVLKAQNVPVITGIDTRALTKLLRIHGTMSGVIRTGIHKTNPVLKLSRAAKVSVAKPIQYHSGRTKTIIAVDCGMKENIMRNLLMLPATITRVPYDYDYTIEPFDAVLISNGPGDPTDYQVTADILKKAMLRKKPVFGICLGAQVMALAAGARTYKLLFGHRGHNQPCLSENGRGYITSQNHGYAIDDKTLPKDWRVTFRNLNDNSVEGIAHNDLPFSAVQFHPEAAPGPTDTNWLFEEFAKTL
jgi:carbamoyl-phosphate synthase small subunit